MLDQDASNQVLIFEVLLYAYSKKEYSNWT